jgi:hypothetical protein
LTTVARRLHPADSGWLVTGKALALRLWQQVEPGETKPERSREYKILETFTALEATAPPGHIHDRDQAPTEQTG